MKNDPEEWKKMIKEIDQLLIRNNLDKKSRTELIRMRNELVFWINYYVPEDVD